MNDVLALFILRRQRGWGGGALRPCFWLLGPCLASLAVRGTFNHRRLSLFRGTRGLRGVGRRSKRLRQIIIAVYDNLHAKALFVLLCFAVFFFQLYASFAFRCQLAPSPQTYFVANWQCCGHRAGWILAALSVLVVVATCICRVFIEFNSSAIPRIAWPGSYDFRRRNTSIR